MRCGRGVLRQVGIAPRDRGLGMLKRPSAEMLLACETILLGFEARKEMKTYRIATIPGDGIGKEVVPEGVRVLEAAARKRFGALAFKETPHFRNQKQWHHGHNAILGR